MGQRRFGIRVLTVFGTRPEAIKLAPVIRAIEAQPDMTSRVCVTAQHREMLDQVLDIFAIVPHHDLDVMTPRQSLASLTARALEGVSGVLDAERPDLVLVQGDTTSAFVSALAAFYHRVPVGHVEAGLRTDDRYNPFPEELNRRLAGVLADLHWAPTARARDNLIREGIAPECITVTGNTVIDALLDVTSRPWPAHDGGLPSPGERIVLITAHRRESLGAPLERICRAIATLADRHPDITFVYPVHLNPSVRDIVGPILRPKPNVRLLEPLDYVSFALLIKRSSLILTDSGGIQEEAPALGVPVLVLRDTTERPEAVEAGAARLVGTDRDRIVDEAERLLTDRDAYHRMARARNPFGDGRAAQRIVSAIARRFGLPHPHDVADFDAPPIGTTLRGEQ